MHSLYIRLNCFFYLRAAFGNLNEKHKINMNLDIYLEFLKLHKWYVDIKI